MTCEPTQVNTLRNDSISRTICDLIQWIQNIQARVLNKTENGVIHKIN